MAYRLAIDPTRNGNDLLATGITCYSLMIVLLYLSVIGIPLVIMVCCKTEQGNQCCVCSTVTTDHRGRGEHWLAPQLNHMKYK